MNHADFCVIFRVRLISQELTPFLQLTTIHIAVSHLSNPSGESSMIVPVLSVNCGAACFSRQCQRLYFSRNRSFLDPQRGHDTPSGQRRTERYSRQFAGSAKYTIASWSVFGSLAIKHGQVSSF